MEFDKVLARIRKLVSFAEADIAPGASAAEREHTMREQQRAREMADALMLEYSISEITADKARPASERQKPGILEIILGSAGQEGWFTTLASRVAYHCHCKIRNYTRYDQEQHAWIAKIYGFESDLRYFEVLYTTLRLHMLGALLPKVDSQQSLEENCYRLHNAGYNWLEIAVIYGWTKYEYDRKGQGIYNWEKRQGIRERHPEISYMKVPYWHEASDEVQPSTQVGSRYKRAYERACKARGEAPTQIPAGGSATFRHSAADGYLARITRRLRDVESTREPGAELILRSRVESDLADLFRQDNPDLYPTETAAPRPEPEECPRCKANKSGSCRQHPLGRTWKPRPYSSAGYAAGVRHADSADLNPNRAGSSDTKKLAG